MMRPIPGTGQGLLPTFELKNIYIFVGKDPCIVPFITTYKFTNMPKVQGYTSLFHKRKQYTNLYLLVYCHIKNNSIHLISDIQF